MSGLADIHQIDVSDDAPLPSADELPKSLLYSIAADVGGPGLPTTAAEGLIAACEGGFLERAVAYSNRQQRVPKSKIRSLAYHPVRLLGSFVDQKTYYGAKKHYLDWAAAREMNTGRYDCFHGWSSDSLRTLIAARQKNVPTMIEIPTWHRNKFREKNFYTRSERERVDTWKSRLHVNRQQMLSEYELADLVLVQSECAAESFVEIGYPADRVFMVARGVDPERFQAATYPSIFRLVFVGALIKRKGIHHLLKAWHDLNLQDAELVLVGSVHDEIKPYLENYKTDTVVLPGFVADVREYLQRSSAFVFISECEGSAKATYEAAACALPQITTRESGDVVVDGLNGKVIPANDPEALADAIKEFYENAERLPEMGRAARRRIEERFTWEHHR
ncbi:MAG: glycosyltransferase involved in cell wall biosynthesis, partial [Pseudoalteromonas tetraodonis]